MSDDTKSMILITIVLALLLVGMLIAAQTEIVTP